MIFNSKLFWTGIVYVLAGAFVVLFRKRYEEMAVTQKFFKGHFTTRFLKIVWLPVAILAILTGCYMLFLAFSLK